MTIRFPMIALAILVSWQANGQSNKYQNSQTYRTNRSAIDNFREQKARNGGFNSREKLRYSDIAGTPYLDSTFRSGAILTDKGVLVDNCLVRYNIFSDRFEYSSERVVREVDPRSMIKRAKIGSLLFTYLKYTEKEKAAEHYFEVVTEGKITLLRKYSLKFNPPVEGAPYGDAKKARFGKPVSEYYLSDGQKDPVSVRNRSAFLEVFGEQKKEVQAFMSKFKLTTGRETDLIKIVNYYNSL